MECDHALPLCTDSCLLTNNLHQFRLNVSILAPAPEQYSQKARKIRLTTLDGNMNNRMAIHPVMGILLVLKCFAAVIMGGFGNIKGTIYSAFILAIV